MSKYLAKRPKARKQRLSRKVISRKLNAVKRQNIQLVSSQLRTFASEVLQSFDMNSSKDFLIWGSLLSILKRDQTLKGNFFSNYCSHLYVSSALTYELFSNKLDDKRLHEYFYTRLNRAKGRCAEKLVERTYPDIIKRFPRRDDRYPFIVASPDGFICNVTS